MNKETIEIQSFNSLKTGLLLLLQEKYYGNGTINNYRRKLNQLELYMATGKINSYDPDVGRRFIDNYLSVHMCSTGGQRFVHTVIRRLDDYCMGDYRLQCKAKHTPLSQIHIALLDVYLQKSRDEGNRETTVSGKDAFL